MSGVPTMEAVARQLRAQDEERGPVTVEISAFHAFCLIAQVQLASRHPENDGPPLDHAIVFARRLEEMLPDDAVKVLALGWDPANDVPV